MTFGPMGMVDSAGAAPRPAGPTSERSVALARGQSHGSPVVALSRSVPLTSLALPVATSAIHNSMPFSLVFRNESRDPSGEKCGFEILACGGTLILISLPSAI